MDSERRNSPVLLVVMGVCGCGKTTIAKGLQQKLAWPMADADDYHSDANKQKMSSGIPLDDEDRLVWLVSLHEVMKQWNQAGSNGIMTCSALKKKYRNILLHGEDIDEPLAQRNGSQERSLQSIVTFVYLKGSYEFLSERINKRTDHFMPSTLLESQLETLEEPSDEEKHLTVDCSKPTESIIADVMTDMSLS